MTNDPNDYFGWPLEMQISIASGYLAYLIAYAGLRRGHAQTDTVFITVMFSAIALMAFKAVPTNNPWIYSGAAITTCVIAAAVWRIVGRTVWLYLMSFLKVHRDTGVLHGWDDLIQAPRAVGQISVHIKGGKTLYLDNRPKYRGAPWGGLLFGGDGSIIMIVEEEEAADGTTEKRSAIVDPNWGTRLTYIPQDEIERVNVRLK